MKYIRYQCLLVEKVKAETFQEACRRLKELYVNKQNPKTSNREVSHFLGGDKPES